MGYFTSGEEFSKEQLKVFPSKLEDANTTFVNHKLQYFVCFNNAESISTNEVKVVKGDTEYIKAFNNVNLEALRKELENKPYKEFNASGISKEDCLNICIEHDKNINSNKSHPLTENEIKLNELNKAKKKDAILLKKNKIIMKLKKLTNYILIILGFIIFIIFIWLLIRVRLPRDIPFNLSMLGFIILIELCYIYGYILYTLFKKDHSTNAFIIYLLDQIFKPLIAFDNFLKNLLGIQSIYLRFMVSLSYKCIFLFKDTSIFYVIFYILPKLILVTALVLDTLYFHQLFYLYKVLLIGILLFLHRYLIYSFKHVKELLILQQEPYISSISMEYIPGVVVCDDDDDDDEIPPTMYIPLRKFIEIQTNAIIYENKRYFFMITLSEKAWKEIRVKYNVISGQRLTSQMICQEIKEEKLKINYPNNIAQLSVIIEYYNITTTNERYKTIKKLITMNYLICWVYILIVSIHTLPADTFNVIWSMIDIEEPFSGININEYG